MAESGEIIIAEDNPRDRQYLQEALPQFRLHLAHNGEEALELIRRHDKPWIISDVQMPKMSGIQLATAVWKTQPNARLLFWTHHKDEMYVRALGRIIPAETVYGYVLKDNTSDTLVRAVRAVFLEEQCWIDPKVRSVQARTTGAGHALTDMEFEVLIDIALGLTDNMIAQRRYLSRRGAQSRLRSLYAKLGVDQEQFLDKEAGEALNLRVRAITRALHRGLINAPELEREEQQLQAWLAARPRADS